MRLLTHSWLHNRRRVVHQVSRQLSGPYMLILCLSVLGYFLLSVEKLIAVVTAHHLGLPQLVVGHVFV